MPWVSSLPLPPQSNIVLLGGPYHYQDFKNNVRTKNNECAIISKTCLPVELYKFILHDAQQDGVSCDYSCGGEYGLNLSKGCVIRPFLSGTFLGENEVTYLEVTKDYINILPNSECVKKSSTVLINVSVANYTFYSCTFFCHKILFCSLYLKLPQAPDINPLNSLVTALDMDMITGSGKSYGILFDIKTTTSVVIAGVELVFATTSLTYYKIWSKEGSWQDVAVDEPNYFKLTDISTSLHDVTSPSLSRFFIHAYSIMAIKVKIKFCKGFLPFP